jgi:hybrid cluster-associated redox disulfide protein
LISRKHPPAAWVSRVCRGAKNAADEALSCCIPNKRTEAVMAIEFTTLVDDIMRRWPSTIRVFITHRMHCVGCPIACFHTVDDACREHGVDRVRFLADLRAAVGQERPELETAGEAGR